MVSTRLLSVVVLIVPLVSAQHGGGHAGGFGHSTAPVVVHPFPSRSTHFGFPGEGNHFGRSGRGYWLLDDGWWPGVPAWYYNVPPLNPAEDLTGQTPPCPGAGNAPEPMPPPPPQSASAVVHEYNFGVQPTTRSQEPPTLTVVLKDGSTRSAEASWVTDGRLHYLDLHSRQQVLSAELIDRNATERANQTKNLHMDLPPD